jgi:hypothetical protein
LLRSRWTPPAFVAALLSLVVLAGCASDWSQPHAAPTAEGTLAPGFAPSASPSPEATITPAPGSWDAVHAVPGMRVVLLTAGDDEPTRILEKAVRDWATEDGADLRTVDADSDHVAGIVKAIGMNADLVISVGNDLIDPLTVVSASHLDQQILVVGAELAEPTANVTAVDWAGASFRGAGLGASSTYDASTFTPERCAAAVQAGIAAVLHDMTGLVVWID